MSAIPVTIVGTLNSKSDSGTAVVQTQVCLVGNLHLTGLAVGGGPIIPPDEIPPGTPVFPIWGPPGITLPPLPGYPPVAGHPLPEPPPPFPEPPADGMVKPPPAEGGWGYHPDYGWGYFPGPGDPQPKQPPAK
jgi:hypothetical protein